MGNSVGNSVVARIVCERTRQMNEDQIPGSAGHFQNILEISQHRTLLRCFDSLNFPRFLPRSASVVYSGTNDPSRTSSPALQHCTARILRAASSQETLSECQNALVVKSVQCIFDSDDRPSGKYPV